MQVARKCEVETAWFCECRIQPSSRNAVVGVFLRGEIKSPTTKRGCGGALADVQRTVSGSNRIKRGCLQTETTFCLDLCHGHHSCSCPKGIPETVSPAFQWPLRLSQSFPSSLLLSFPQRAFGFHYRNKGLFCFLIY